MENELGEEFRRAIIEFENFFGFKLNQEPEIIFVKTREEIDKIKGRKTEDWVIGWADENKIYLLDPENYEKESSHKYSYGSYICLLKHELVHIFDNQMLGALIYPLWLGEGLAVFLSGQIKLMKEPPKLKKFMESYDEINSGLYGEGGFAVKFLIENFGKEKLFALMKNLRGVKDEKEFENIFKKFYGVDLRKVFN